MPATESIGFLDRFDRREKAPPPPPLDPSQPLDVELMRSLERFKPETLPLQEEQVQPDAPSRPNPLWTFLAGFFSWKAMAVVAALSILYWYMYPFLTSGKRLIQSVYDLLNVASEVTSETPTAAQLATGQIPTKKPSKAKTSSPEPDEATSSVQGGAGNGFCLAGEWKGVRSCVGVPKGQACVSGQLFPTNEQCVNPTLR